MNTNNYTKEGDLNVSFFSPEEVGKSWRDTIRIRFETLINSRDEFPYDWYKALDLDKADASRIKRGLVIPNKEWRIRIAKYFGVDSSTIWTAKDIVEGSK